MMISRRFSVPVDQLKEINHLKTGNIRTGQNLVISQKEDETDTEEDGLKNKNVKKSAKKSTINKKVLSASDIDKLGADKYIVTKNDSLHSIAKKNNTNISKLIKLNKLSMDEKLIPGQILIVK